MSQYITTKMALSGGTLCDEVRAGGKYAWRSDGKCLDKSTGQVYSGDQSQSNCACLGPPPAQSGWDAVLNWGKDQAGQLIQNKYGQSASYQGQPSAGLTSSALFLPAVVGIGILAVVLITKKKK